MERLGVMGRGRRGRRWIVGVAVLKRLNPAVLTSHSPERIGIRVESDPLRHAR